MAALPTEKIISSTSTNSYSRKVPWHYAVVVSAAPWMQQNAIFTRCKKYIEVTAFSTLPAQ